MVVCPPGCIPDPNYKPPKGKDGRPPNKWLPEGADKHLPWPPKKWEDIKKHLLLPGYARGKEGPRSEKTAEEYMQLGFYKVWRGLYNGQGTTISNWDWLDKTTENIAWILHVAVGGESTKRKILSGMQAICKVMRKDDAANEYGKTAANLGHMITAQAATNESSEEQKARFKPISFLDKNIMILDEAATRLGTSRGAGVSKALFNRVWMALVAYKVLVQSINAAHRLQSIYTTEVLEFIPSEKKKKALEKAGRNYFSYDPSKPKGPVYLTMNRYKTRPSHKETAEYEFTEPHFVIAFRNSMKAYPRKWFLSKVTKPDTEHNESEASKFITESYVVPVAPGELKPTSMTIRHIINAVNSVMTTDTASREEFAKRSLTSVTMLETHYKEKEVLAFLSNDVKNRARVKMTAEMQKVVDAIVAGTYTFSAAPLPEHVDPTKKKSFDEAFAVYKEVEEKKRKLEENVTKLWNERESKKRKAR